MLNKKELIIVASISSIIIIIAGLICLRLYIKSETQITGYPGISGSDYKRFYQEEFEKCMNEPWVHQCMAYVTGDLNLCDKWVEINNDIEDRDLCADGYILIKAITLEEGDSCDKIRRESMRLLCKAIKTQERSYCNLIENDEITKGMCISVMTNRLSCEGLTGRDRELCKEKFEMCAAISQDKIDMCESLKIKEDRVTCKALLSNDPEICKEESLDSCRDEAELEAQRRIDGKNLDMGANHRNLSYCEKIVDENMKDCCISVANNDLELCKHVKDEYAKLYCVVQIAEIRKNFDLCGLLDGKIREDCINYFKNF